MCVYNMQHSKGPLCVLEAQLSDWDDFMDNLPSALKLT